MKAGEQSYIIASALAAKVVEKMASGMTAQAAHASQIADMAVKAGMPADQREAFLATISVQGFAGNCSAFAQSCEKAEPPIAYPREKKSKAAVGAAALALV